MEWQTWHRLKLAGIKVQHKSQLQHLCLLLQLFPHNSHRAAFFPSQDLSGGYMGLTCGPIVAEFITVLHCYMSTFVTCITACCFATTSFYHCFSFPGDSEHMSGLPSAVSDSKFPSPSLGLPSATPSSSLGLASAATPASSATPTAASRVESSGPRSLPPHMGFPQNKDVPSSAPLTVGTK